MKPQTVPELTRISSKGQVVIPARIRNRLHIKAGGVFAILTQPRSGIVILKRVDSKSLRVDLSLFREIEKAWREIEQGKARRASTRRFLEALQTW